MVARGGIEPPTPAFSGPRSTTELPGLSADFVAISCAGSGADPGVGVSANSALQQLCQYTNSLWLRQTLPCSRPGRISSFLRLPSGRSFLPARLGHRTLDDNYATPGFPPSLPG